jgi:hypothetical protein
MEGFTQKLRLIYTKLFNENIDKFTESLIDYQKFQKDKFNAKSEEDAKKQFFFNRKIVLRRWLSKGITCTHDFQKSFQNYKLSLYQLRGKPLFSLSDFRENGNVEEFEDRIEHFLSNRNRVQIKSNYIYIYSFCEIEKKIFYYKIIKWIKGDRNETIITVERENNLYSGTFSLSDENNIFMTLCIDGITSYFLFHDNNDTSCPYIVGTSMGYLPQDNKVPRSQKVIFSKEKLDEKAFDLQFILNETESISAIENRLNLNFQEVKITHFVKYANKLKQFFIFFENLSRQRFKEHFYYRLAFREFYAVSKLFQKLSKKESYFIYDYQRALCELIKTVEDIKNIPLYMVMELSQESIFLQITQKNLDIKRRFLNLYSTATIATTIIFVVQDREKSSKNIKKLLDELLQHNIEVHLVNRDEIINEVNSLDFIFIDLKDRRDFVLADPIRDSKDVYKLFTNDVTMDEYKTDYQKFLIRSEKVVSTCLNQKS